jgi:ATP-dependent RNA circularization protein (DNA/RNA ligase family)
MSNTYNGWTNYATWRVNLEMFDNTNLEDLTGNTEWDASDLAEYLTQWAVEIIENDTPEGGLARDYALAFLDDVNWYEIAKHMINDYVEEHAE